MSLERRVNVAMVSIIQNTGKWGGERERERERES